MRLSPYSQQADSLKSAKKTNQNSTTEIHCKTQVHWITERKQRTDYTY